MEQSPLRRRLPWLALGAAVLLALLGAWYAISRGLERTASMAVASRGPAIEARPLEGTRIRVEVLNASRTRGLARRATMYLRDRGFDVVETGTARDLRDTTLVLDRSNRCEWAELVAEALGGAPVETRPDSLRYLDVTVLLGASWRPPAKPFYP